MNNCFTLCGEVIALRKILSVFLTVVIISCFVITGQSVALIKERSVYQFASELKSMIQENKSFVKSRKSFKSEAQLPDELSDYSEGRLIVKTSKPLITDKAVSVINGYRDLWIIQYSSPEEAKEADDYYSSISSVEYSEPDRIAKLDLQNQEIDVEVQGGSNQYLSWGSYACGFDAANRYLSSSENLNEVMVGVLDTGIDIEHPFLKNRLIDEGRNFSTSGDETCQSDDPFSHGTHVTGIIVDNTPDIIKVRGYKVGNSDLETTESIVAVAIDAAVADGMQVLNMSLGGLNSQTLFDSMERAFQSGVILVQSAGNDYSIVSSLPGIFEKGITVGAVAEDYSIADFSNHGNLIDIVAPGVRITSTLNNNTFGVYDGTSMAAPFVTAAAAIIKSVNPVCSPENIENRIKSAAIPLDVITKFCGAGLLDVATAINIPSIEPASVNLETGVYYESLTIMLDCPPNSSTYYTLDGSIPEENNENAAVYIKPIIINQTTEVRWCTYPNDKNVYRSKFCSSNYTIVFDASESDFTITSDGILTGYTGEYGDIIVPESINGIIPVSVGKKAFFAENGGKLKSVYLPSTVATVEAEAFSGNNYLILVSAPGVDTVGNKAFIDCISLKSIYMPDLVTINDYAFKNCEQLEYIIFDRVKSIGSYAFERNMALTDAVFNSLESLGSEPFRNSFIETANFPVLQSYKAKGTISSSRAFRGDPDLTEIIMPNILTLGDARHYESGAFFDQINLKKVYAPKLKEVNVGAFGNCFSLETVSFGEAEEIHSYAFYDCQALKEINLPNVTSIHPYAFFRCFSLKHLDLPKAEIIYDDSISYCRLEYLRLYESKTIESLPLNNCTVLIPSTTNSISFISGNNSYYTIYGTSDTYAEEWATGNHSNYSTEFIPVPALLSSLPDSVCSGESISLDAIGFNLTYQWYGVNDNGEHTIKGAIESNYSPSGKDYFSSYYCRITSDDHGIVSTFDTDQIPFIFIEADYSTLDEILSTIPEDLSIYTEESVLALNDIISGIDRNLDASEQAIVDGYVEAVSNTIAALKLKEHMVSFIVDNESVLSYELEYGSEITDFPPNPEKRGYTFSKWTPDIPPAMPNNSFTFTAEFEPVTYYASFMVNGKEIEKVPFTIESESISEPEIPVKDGYTGKWSEYIIAASDITVKAEYTINEYTVSFVADNKTIKSESVEYGSAIEIPDNPQKEGHIFKEWLPKVPETMPAKNMTFYAMFEEVKQPDDNPPAVVNPSVDIRNFAYTCTVDYRTTITFTAITKDMPKNAAVVWYIDGQKSGEGEMFTVKEAKEAFTVQAKIVDKSGNVLNGSETELVKVKTDFFSKIIAFFRMLFGILPVIEQ